MWKSKPYSYEGKYFRVPERNVFPKPYGPAHPAMWVAAGSPPTFGEAAELGLGAFCFSNGAPSQLAPLVKNYKRSEEHTSELQSLMRISYAVFCLKKKKKKLTIQQIQLHPK